MKTAILTTVLGLTSVFASAAPADVVRRDMSLSSSFPVPAASSSGAAPTGMFPTGTGMPFPSGTGLARRSEAGAICSANGELICNGPEEFGICNWGRVRFAPVAKGTSCIDGRISYNRGL